jgi:hypothetical protein
VFNQVRGVGIEQVERGTAIRLDEAAIRLSAWFFRKACQCFGMHIQMMHCTRAQKGHARVGGAGVPAGQQ